MQKEINEEDQPAEAIEQGEDKAYAKETTTEEKDTLSEEREMEEEEDDKNNEEVEDIVETESDSQPIGIMPEEDEGKKERPTILNIPDPYVTVQKNITIKKQLTRICKELKCNIDDIKKNYAIRKEATKLYYRLYQESFEKPLDARDWQDKINTYGRKPKIGKKVEDIKDSNVNWLLETLDDYNIKLPELDSNLKIKQGFREEYEKEFNKSLKADELNNLIRRTKKVLYQPMLLCQKPFCK